MGDNTPQGKLSGCLGWFLAIIVGFVLFIAVVDVAAHGVCRYLGSDCRAFECGWFRVCKDKP